ncbi:hypothetical protein [Streptomyces sp. CS014]|uniref:hypothetical protein n=1 Tax=Streptomyces sp. CS014 TaxID=2162707 RepID=UPI000D50BDA2|nr:hypothetical protein [Streptomyces sp. CS014]PVD04510.1 hypothetical protein DBP12_03540 [Streptomyces sp. CS014]
MKQARKKERPTRRNSVRKLMSEALTHPGGYVPGDTPLRLITAMAARNWIRPVPDGTGWELTRTGRDAHHKHSNHITT